jgi:hypothetical protein
MEAQVLDPAMVEHPAWEAPVWEFRDMAVQALEVPVREFLGMAVQALVAPVWEFLDMAVQALEVPVWEEQDTAEPQAPALEVLEAPGDKEYHSPRQLFL